MDDNKLRNIMDCPIRTPYYLIDMNKLHENLVLLRSVADKAGCKILLAQKAYSMYSTYPMIAEYLDGSTASGLFEARLGHEEMEGETHIFSPAYCDDEIDEIADICDHVIFNSIGQWDKYKHRVIGKASCGLRINPELSTQSHGIYDPCSFGSRLGITRAEFPNKLPEGIDGLHFHTLCEQNSDDLIKTLDALIEKFGDYLFDLKWINFGGGHHITRSDYDIDALVLTIRHIKEKYKVEVYLEPGEAVVLDAGYMVTSVVDIVKNNIDIAIMDSSAACHMPDVIEMPYRPRAINSGVWNELAYNYRLGGPTCLAGDIIGDYSYNEPLKIGTKVIFEDMAIYSFVKNNTFNGMRLPSLATIDSNNNIKLIREYGYTEFKRRLS